MTARALLAAIAAVLISIPSFATEKKANAADRLPTATVLCYHIVESPHDDRMEVSRDTFRQQMQYLEMTGYNVIPLRHVYEYVMGKRNTLPQNAVVVTFDDGWRSTYTEVLPEMKKRGFPFTVFVYPRIIGQTAYALTWSQIREMSDAGVDFQSHSLSHGYLTRRRHSQLDDRAYNEWLQQELAESKRQLEKQTGKTVSFIAYPYGDFDHTVTELTGKAGYAAGLTCEFGRVKRGSDPLRMKRFVIDKRMDFAEFRRYLGATPMQLAEMTPPPGKDLDPEQVIISARLPKPQSIDPKSVGMALLSTSATTPFAYDARTGAISVTVRDGLLAKGRTHRAIVWARDAKTGKRVEASWTFRLPEPPPQPLPTMTPVIAPAVVAQPAAAGGGATSELREVGSGLTRAPKR